MVVGGGGWWYIKSKGEKITTSYYYNRVPCAAGWVGKEWFQQSASTHSGAGQKETLNINPVNKKNKTKTTTKGNKNEHNWIIDMIETLKAFKIVINENLLVYKVWQN